MSTANITTNRVISVAADPDMRRLAGYFHLLIAVSEPSIKPPDFRVLPVAFHDWRSIFHSYSLESPQEKLPSELKVISQVSGDCESEVAVGSRIQPQRRSPL